MSKTALVIENTDFRLRFLRRVLGQQGFQVIRAEITLDPLVHCRRNMPDIIFVDDDSFDIPEGGTGLDYDIGTFMRSLRAIKGGESAKVIWASPDSSDVSYLREYGVDAVVKIPLVEAQIVQALRELHLIDAVSFTG